MPSPTPIQRPTVVRCDQVTKTYDDGGVQVEALCGVSLEIASGRFTMIVGPSGSGKTTLLNLIGCIDRPTSGQLQVCGRDVAALSDNQISDFRAENVAFVFQGFNLFPVLTAHENVEYPLRLLGVGAAERRARAAAMLEAVGLSPYGHHRPNQLSGGQKQRVAIARALIKHPALVLADEPTANLDTRTGAEIIALMRRIQAEQAVSFVFSTHDPQLMSHADQTFAIRDGRRAEVVQ
ncbi:MAG TPA: ABC transporter ATP-binding protein [Polyangia bacterium]|nr:ABC transporter ATP-binding protein [Polyangia bacterium]